MKTTEIEASQEEIDEKLEEYGAVQSKEGFVKKTKEAYTYLKKGFRIIDVFETFKHCGTMKGLPRLAIARADQKTAILSRKGNFGRMKTHKSLSNMTWTAFSIDVSLPKGTLPKLTEYIEVRKMATANAPIIPARHLPKNKLDKYFILWEVKKWGRIEEPKRDPLLLKRLTKNLFVVIASWDLTNLESKILR
jgi:hypothetical protein